MKKIYKALLLLIALGLCAGCGLTASTETDYPAASMVDDKIVQTYPAEEKEGRLKSYYELADGTWRTEDYSYLYKLELTGRMNNAAKDSTFICLSNSEDVSFSKVAWSMISSNMADRLDRKEVVIVEMLIVENVSPTPTPVPGQDAALPTTMIDGEIYFMSGMYATTKPSEISRIKEIIEQAEYLGTTTKISAKEYPTKDLESNCLEEGCGIYRCADGERINFIVVRPNGLTYRYVSGWTKYQWFEGKLVNAGEQEYLKTGMPTATPAPTVTPAPIAVPVVQAPQYVLSKAPGTLTTEDGEILQAYVSVLEGLLYEEELPEHDVEVEYMYTTYPDLFSICDIDADGKDELYIAHIATYNAGMFTVIYEYKDGKLHRELLADTLLQFYDNGVLLQKAMHNHGMAAGEDSDFWPYTLFQYDSVTDSYAAVANVDAWDKSYAETDWDGTAFPDKADIDGDGRVYYVMPGTRYEWQEPMDNAAYQEWYASYMGGAGNRYKLPSLDLTEDSIEELKKLVTTIPNEDVEKEDLLTLLKINYDGQIPSSASSPYVLQTDGSSGMIVFGEGATTLIYVTKDGGATWEPAEIPEVGNHQHAIVTCAAAISDTVYCVGYRYWGVYDGAFYLTEDCGKTWTRLSPEVAIPEEITANMRYAEAVAVNYVGDRLQVQVSCKTTVFPPWSIEVKLESADFGKTWDVVEIREKETDAE